MMERISPQRDTYTDVGTGTAIEVGGAVQNFSLQVAGDKVAATSWSVNLEGSLDGVNFEPLLTHTETHGDGRVIFNGNQVYPVMFIRSKVTALTLGSATRLMVYILGMP